MVNLSSIPGRKPVFLIPSYLLLACVSRPSVSTSFTRSTKNIYTIYIHIPLRRLIPSLSACTQYLPTDLQEIPGFPDIGKANPYLMSHSDGSVIDGMSYTANEVSAYSIATCNLSM